MYAPAAHEEKNKYYKEFFSNLENLTNQEHFLIGDLNVHFSAEDSPSCARNVPQNAKKVFNAIGAIDWWRNHKDNSKRTELVPTYVKHQEDKLITSKIDYFLCSHICGKLC